MTALITLDEVLSVFESDDLPEDEVQHLIDEADEAIVLRFGPHTASSVTWEANGTDTRYLWLTRPATAVSSVTYRFYSYTDLQTVPPSNYRLERNGLRLTRTYGPWLSDYIYNVTFTPKAEDVNARRQVTMDLVRVGLQNQGLITNASEGGYSAAYEPYEKARARILRRLKRFRPGSMFR